MNCIKEVLKRKGIKQTWLAEELGKSFNSEQLCSESPTTSFGSAEQKEVEILEVDIKELIK